MSLRPSRGRDVASIAGRTSCIGPTVKPYVRHGQIPCREEFLTEGNQLTAKITLSEGLPSMFIKPYAV